MQMQMQQRQYENYMNRQRVVMGLQTELQSLVYRIQQAQMGVYTGGYLGFDAGIGGGVIGGGGFPGQPMPMPYPGNPPFGTTPPYGTMAPVGSQIPAGFPQTGAPAPTGTAVPVGTPSVR